MNKTFLRIYLVVMIIGLWSSATVEAQTRQAANTVVTYNTVKIGGLDVFFREAGDKSKPAILLLHGFPTSSQMFRNLIPQLADKYYVIAPDYPGFGQSSIPKINEFEYTFDNLSKVVEKFTETVGLKKYSPMCRITAHQSAIVWRSSTRNECRR